MNRLHSVYLNLNSKFERILARFGVYGDGLTDDGEALQRVLDSRPSRIVIAAGTYLVGRSLRIHSGTTLCLEDAASLRLADGVALGADDYLLSNANSTSGDQDISIEGGVWDGNNRGNPRPNGLLAYGCSGAIMHFRNVNGLRLKNLHLRDAEAYYVRMTSVSNFHVESVRFSSNMVRPNNDGIHIGGNCEGGVIRDIKGLHAGVTGDDLVALNADDALSRCEVRGMSCGPIRRISIENLAADSCHSFVRLLSVWSPIEDITIRNVRGSCDVAALNCDAARGCRVALFDEKTPPYSDGVGMLRNIHASDFLVAKAAANQIPLLRLETRMENFRISNFMRDLSNDLDSSAPTLRLRHVIARRLELNKRSHQLLSVNDVFTSSINEIDEMKINMPTS